MSDEHNEKAVRNPPGETETDLAELVARDVRLLLNRVEDLDIRVATLQLELAALAGITLLLVAMAAMKIGRAGSAP